MGILSRFGRQQPGSSDHPGDDALLAEIASRSDLAAPRHWVHYVYVADEDAAIPAAARIAAGGWHIKRVGEAASGPGWVVIAEQHDVVTSPEAVRDARVFFEAVACDVPGGDYDGWEASI